MSTDWVRKSALLLVSIIALVFLAGAIWAMFIRPREVKQTVEVEKIVKETVEVEKEVTRIVEGEAPVSPASEDEAEASAPASAAPASMPVLPANVDPIAWETVNRPERLVMLDETFREGGIESWLLSSGISWDRSFSLDARQPEETTVSVLGQTAVVLSGVQVSVKDLVCEWPCVVTTDQPSRIRETAQTRKYRPDTRVNGNTSVLYTNVVANGPVTVYPDGRDWGQMFPGGSVQSVLTSQPASPIPSLTLTRTATLVPTPTAAKPAANCGTLAQLLMHGQLDRKLFHPEGVLAGAQITAEHDFDVPSDWTAHVQGQTVTTVKRGQKVSLWLPEECRPLSKQ